MTSLRLLGAFGVLWAVNATIVTVLITRNRPDVYTVPAIVALVANLVLSVVLIPRSGADGAATAALAAAALHVTILVPRTARLFGAAAYGRMLGAPIVAGAVMAACAAAVSGIPWVAGALLSVAAYGAAFLAIERLFSPGDFAYYASVARIRDGG